MSKLEESEEKKQESSADLTERNPGEENRKYK